MATAKKAKGTAQLNAEVPANLKKSLKLLATERGTTLGKLVTQVLSDYINESKNEDVAPKSNSLSQGAV